MAPATADQVEENTKDVLQNLYSIMFQAYDHRGPRTTAAMQSEVMSLVESLQNLSRSAASLPNNVPPEVITEYVGGGRNPDIYTREFVELVQRRNQSLKGKAEAYGTFSGELAQQIIQHIPDMEIDVKNVVSDSNEANGKALPIMKKEER